jgi:hypothetical protein
LHKVETGQDLTLPCLKKDDAADAGGDDAELLLDDVDDVSDGDEVELNDMSGQNALTLDLDRANDADSVVASGSDDDELGNYVLEEILAEERRVFPWQRLLFLAGVWLVMCTLILFKGGGKGNESVIGVTCGSLAYWLLIVSIYPILIGATAWVCWREYNLCKLKQQCNYPFVSGDVHWTPRSIIALPAMSVLAGVAAGFLGIGGGMVKGPLMLEMGYALRANRLFLFLGD